MPSPHSWTNKMAKYLLLLDPHQTGEVELFSRNPTTGEATLGKVIGPDGLPFFKVDAPWRAVAARLPVQHVHARRRGHRGDAVRVDHEGRGQLPLEEGLSRWLRFFWVARLTDLTTFKWLLLMLPELKRLQLVHNQYYVWWRKDQERIRKQQHADRGDRSGEQGEAAAPQQAAGRLGETRNAQGQLYYYNAQTQETSWTMPEMPTGDNARAELHKLQSQLRESTANARSLTIALYLTGCKPTKSSGPRTRSANSSAEMINALLSTCDPETGEPYIILKAGRPDWSEFKQVAGLYGRENLGVVFCGADGCRRAQRELREALEERPDHLPAAQGEFLEEVIPTEGGCVAGGGTFVPMRAGGGYYGTLTGFPAPFEANAMTGSSSWTGT